ncbi:GNAT family N-acetyltransferase [Streptomyces sp. NPDC005805]|uniref:GNAT family N-acetyltransferase n=1 Tax=Streptomyces sp. NPDC005805 TaxID=3157068 RepID=UPI0033E6A9AC
MPEFVIGNASAQDRALMREWAEAEGWNPGDSDLQAFAVADPRGFLTGRLDGVPVGCVSAVRQGAAGGFIGFYITSPPVRGQGYGIRLWRAATERLAGRLTGLDGVVAQQHNYRKSGFRRAWTNLRFEGVPGGVTPVPPGVRLCDARTLPFDALAAYDRRFVPAERDAFLAAWTGLPGRTAVAALRDGELCGLGVVRPCAGASRIGPLYAAGSGVAVALLGALAEAAGGPVAIDVPDVCPGAAGLVSGLGLEPVFETARMYTGPAPVLDAAGLYGVTSLELG